VAVAVSCEYVILHSGTVRPFPTLLYIVIS